MNKNVKIAKELIKLAKSLVAYNVADDVADKEGKYENFTGEINFVDNNALVKKATFTLKDNSIIWENGTWEKGTWHNGTWENGTWEYGTWENGTFKNGTWKDGTWENGTWEKGTWEYGTWKNGTWLEGTWRKGEDKNENKHKRTDSPDKWDK